MKKIARVTITVTKTFSLLARAVPGRRQYFMIHVRYFGDNGRHSWVSARCMMRFTSLADFKKLSESVTAETKKKDPRYAAAFVVKQSMKAKWENAVDETTEVQPMTIEERVATFAPKTKATKSKNAKSSTTDEKNRNNKRKHSIDQSEPDAKRAKHDVINGLDLIRVNAIPFLLISNLLRFCR